MAMDDYSWNVERRKYGHLTRQLSSLVLVRMVSITLIYLGNSLRSSLEVCFFFFLRKRKREVIVASMIFHIVIYEKILKIRQNKFTHFQT